MGKRKTIYNDIEQQAQPNECREVFLLLFTLYVINKHMIHTNADSLDAYRQQLALRFLALI